MQKICKKYAKEYAVCRRVYNVHNYADYAPGTLQPFLMSPSLSAGPATVPSSPLQPGPAYAIRKSFKYLFCKCKRIQF